MDWYRFGSLQWKLFGLFAFFALLIGAQTAFIYQTAIISAQTAAQVTHTLEVIATAGDALSALQSRQSSYRGFLLTGHESFLDPYRGAEPIFRDKLAELVVVTADNPPQVRRWQEIERRATTWERQVADPGIELRRQVNWGQAAPDEIPAYAVTSGGDERFEEIRQAFTEAIAVEQALLVERAALAGTSRRESVRLLFGATFAVLALGLLAVIFLARGIGQAARRIATAARQIARVDLPSLIQATRAVAAGDLTQRARVTTPHVAIHSRDQLGEMARDFNLLIDGLQATSDEVAAVTHLLDTTARAAAAERDTLRATLEAAQDGILIVAPDGRLELSNTRVAEWFGTSVQDLGEPAAGEWASVVCARAEDPEIFGAWLQEILAEPDRRDARRLRLSAGPVSAVDCYSSPVTTPAGASIGRVFIFHDISREAELAQVKDELVSVVSHELRTPLASLVGFAELLLTREIAEPQRRQYLGVMREEGQRLTALINDFLDLQRMEGSALQIAAVPTDLAPIVERAVASAGISPQHPLEIDLPPSLPPVRADADRVQQVLTNLISNARKYSPDGGAICLAASAANGTVTVSITDHGLGFPPESEARLFDKFYRVDNSDRRAIRGTGLGLAICRQIVAAHGGQIVAASAGLGHGARFSFTLPAATTNSLSAAADVLIVEDDAGFARLLEAELATHGLTATWAADAEAALEILASHRPRAILLDLSLPDIPGEELLTRPAMRDLSGIPVVIVTMKDLVPAERQALYRRGVVGMVQKGPRSAGLAVAAVAQALGSA